MAKIQWQGGALLAPVPPVLVTSGTLQNPNVCTVAWCGIVSTKPPKTYISLRPQRHSYSLIQQNKEFVLNLPVASLVRSIDRCGVKSGRDEDKFATCRLTPEPANIVAPPLLAECPVSIECRVEQIIPLGSHDMFLAEIIAVDVDEELIDENGKLHLAKAGLAAYAHGEYFALGKRIGTFGFSVRKKRKNPHKKQAGQSTAPKHKK